MASAPLRSLAALAICGRYATTRRLLHSVNAASVMSAIAIRSGTVGQLPGQISGRTNRLGRTPAFRKVSIPLRSDHGVVQVLTMASPMGSIAPTALASCWSNEGRSKADMYRSPSGVFGAYQYNGRHDGPQNEYFAEK